MVTLVYKRIEKILRHYKINQKQLSELTGISENTISNAKKGKNIPGIDFFNAVYSAFPQLNHFWLYMGKGEMLVENSSGSDSNFLHENSLTSDDCNKILKSLEKEIHYLREQIKDKEEIITLLRNKLKE